MVKSFLIAGLFFGLVLIQKEPNNWRGIVPLVTKRAGVEALLGASTFGSGYILSYDTPDERITVWYGGARSPKDNPCKWDVPADTVVNFLVALKKPLLLSEAKLDLKKFEKHEDLEIRGDFFYFNQQDGVTVETRTVEGKELVGAFDYNPTLKDRTKYCHQGDIKVPAKKCAKRASAGS